jgi:superfamily II DNA or RNA helicase/SAM-dependent methyltransferase
MAEHQTVFLARLPEKAHILDAGSGSGRDSRVFLDAGFRVTAIDASAELARQASTYLGQTVGVQRFEDIDEIAVYHGIWASASLLHVPADQLPRILDRLWVALRPGGVFYCSFPIAVAAHEAAERHYTTLSAPKLRELIQRLPLHGPIEIWESADAMAGRDRRWVNALVERAPTARPHLITGGLPDPFLPHLLSALQEADTSEIAVSFIRITGLNLLLPELHVLMDRGGQLHIVTSDYLGITEPQALRHLAILQERGAQVRVFETDSNTSFHMKAYIFTGMRNVGQDGAHWGRAFVGSSNISELALRAGLEWNYRVDYPGDPGFLEARARFSALYNDPRTKPLTHQWIDTYADRRRPPPVAVAPGSDETLPPPTPHEVQQEALLALAQSRREGYQRGLVVLATGLGKTWLSAFDVEQTGARRVLFVAHREEILSQAAETYQRIRPRARIGFWQGARRDQEFDILFASIQTIGKEQHLNRFAPDFFDYVVVDEFHHAAASTYRRLLRYVHPRFLLGMTATPSRTDNADILAFCDDNLVYQQTIVDGITRDLLVPFRYFGIADENVDYQAIPWRSGRFDPQELSVRLATINRARHSLTVWREHTLKRTLAFCVSRSHADFSAEYFKRQGVRAVAAHGASAVTREDALSGLASGEIQIVFSVDLFSEGIDVPSIDSVMMLRPTESSILFLQQLGRGLRLCEGKKDLVVIDFVANHSSFLHKPMALMGSTMTRQELVDFARQYEDGTLELPPGCYLNFDPQYIDFLKRLTDGAVETDYRRLRDTLGRRPTALEFYRGGGSLPTVRQNHGHWFAFVQREGDLAEGEARVASQHGSFLEELQTTRMEKSFKMILLEAFQELDGWRAPPTLTELNRASWQEMRRKAALHGDVSLGATVDFLRAEPPAGWPHYWRTNPIKAWLGENRPQADPNQLFFTIANDAEDKRFAARFSVVAEDQEAFEAMVQELIDLRLARYLDGIGGDDQGNSDTASDAHQDSTPVEIPYFTELAIACGHFRTGAPGVEEYRKILLPPHDGAPQGRYFLAHASGSSMDGGNQPIRDGDTLLLELLDPSPDRIANAAGDTVALERQQSDGTYAYLLRRVVSVSTGTPVLRANHPDYPDLPLTPELLKSLRTVARLIRVVDPLEFRIGQAFPREEIPPLFGEEFNVGN